MFDFFHKRPYLLYSLIAGLFVLGIYGLIVMPKNLFPDSDRPTVIIMSQVPGATPGVVAATVSKPVEQEVSTLSLIRKVSSTNIAGMSIVSAEFEYKKGLDAAAVDINNAINRVRGKLPAGVNPSIYTAGSFVLPVDVFALSPANRNMDIDTIRKLVASDIKPALLRNPEVGNVEVFGGFESAININIDPFAARAHGISLDKIAGTIRALDRDLPLGFSKGDDSFFTVTYYGERDRVEDLQHLPVAPNVILGDIATINWQHQRRFSGYLGNGRQAIAIAIQRAPGGSVLATSTAARAETEKLKTRYPNIRFELADTQRTLIKTANTNMLEALRDAIIFTLLVILLFLGNLRAVTAALASIPMVFFGTIAIIWMFGGELNLIIYTAIILALGMLVDDAVVVLENIERHLAELKEDLQTAIVNGTKEVIAPVFAGTVATIAIMFPFLFAGDFPQQIFRPLISTLIIALLVSYFLSITFIPAISFYLYRKGTDKLRLEIGLERLYQKTFGRLVQPYLAILKFSAGGRSRLRRTLMTLGVLVILALSIRNIMPVIGRDLMPPMDTGIIKAHVRFSANETVETAEKRIAPFLGWLHQQPEVAMSSVSFGSEPGVLSLGSGSLPTETTMTINCVDRFHRQATIWQLEDRFRRKLAGLQNVKAVDVYDFGATPLSSIKAPVNVQLQAEDYNLLPAASRKVAAAMQQVKGLTSISTSWDKDFTEAELDIDSNRALAYGITPVQIAAQLPLAGIPVTLSGNLVTMQTQFVRLYFNRPFDKRLQDLRLIPIQTARGPVPLESLAKIRYRLTANKIERNNLRYAVDVSGYRARRAISTLTGDTEKALQSMDLPGVEVHQEGDMKQMGDTFKRMIKSIGIGVVLLLMALIAIYQSLRMSIVMILVLPLSMIGASWGMLIFNKPSCMPSLVGIMLLFGIIIKNSVLLIDFYQHYRQAGNAPFDAALESVRVRFRPVLMTAFGTIAGMIPIAFEWAVGLERLSPLADVAIGGLIIGTILTLIYIPIFAYSVEWKTIDR
ncbi:AcrB/AcrD/AcrF family protein [Geothermobacter hydrogeniphilus]|uniref:AcrB/AcrD/AcrF family protein n=1 Tax=Geothermobacter hydrogeniphilus TaxID=1969733 RepID=A0A2K2HCM8_9BACT|nr:efflux RND transporter permease subunit [Geothermobacter hydrogeniphilus]PNU20999.1 AcrB/AcrD/AcrF family protein [Geothermobacter hydrogeniphilus]